jgi:hypothetical protein
MWWQRENVRKPLFRLWRAWRILFLRMAISMAISVAALRLLRIVLY